MLRISSRLGIDGERNNPAEASSSEYSWSNSSLHLGKHSATCVWRTYHWRMFKEQLLEKKLLPFSQWCTHPSLPPHCSDCCCAAHSPYCLVPSDWVPCWKERQKLDPPGFPGSTRSWQNVASVRLCTNKLRNQCTCFCWIKERSLLQNTLHCKNPYLALGLAKFTSVCLAGRVQWGKEGRNLHRKLELNSSLTRAERVQMQIHNY